MVKKIAKVLKVPAGYFYIEEDHLAELILEASKLSKKDIINLTSSLTN